MTTPVYRLVPEEPTREMLLAMEDVRAIITWGATPEGRPKISLRDGMTIAAIERVNKLERDIWRAMLAAAPQPEPPADLVESAQELFISLAENMRHERDGDGMWCGDSNSWVNIKIQAEKIVALAQEHAASLERQLFHASQDAAIWEAKSEAEKARADKAEKALAGVSDQLGDPAEWKMKLEELHSWTGSAFLAGEPVEDEGRHKLDLYTFTCSLIGYFMAAESAAIRARKGGGDE